MFKEKIKQIGKQSNDNNKRKVENIITLIIVLIVTVIIMNSIIKKDSKSSTKNEHENDESKTLASIISNDDEKESTDLEKNLEKILSTIKGVGNVNVFINYSESSKVVAMYDEKTTTSSTEENDSSGGIRNTTSTEKQKNVIYSEDNGDQKPMTEKVVMPTIEGAVITASGAANASVKSNIVSAVEAATGLTIDKIQVFEMK